jgi:hypothetical protein
MREIKKILIKLKTNRASRKKEEETKIFGKKRKKKSSSIFNFSFCFYHFIFG